MKNIEKFPTVEALAAAAAEYIIAGVEKNIREQGRYSIALSGGSTPKVVYELLATPAYAGRIDWSKVHVFWGDERCVPPDHHDSNYLMAATALLGRVPIPSENIHRMHGEADPKEAARAYEADLRAYFGANFQHPRFDLVLLGLGDDGHTASLFPYSSALAADAEWVVGHYVEKLSAWRLTLTAPAINAAEQVIFLVTGEKKAAILQDVTTAPYNPQVLPAQLINPISGILRWLVDDAAGALI